MMLSPRVYLLLVAGLTFAIACGQNPGPGATSSTTYSTSAAATTESETEDSTRSDGDIAPEAAVTTEPEAADSVSESENATQEAEEEVRANLTATPQQKAPAATVLAVEAWIRTVLPHAATATSLPSTENLRSFVSSAVSTVSVHSSGRIRAWLVQLKPDTEYEIQIARTDGIQGVNPQGILLGVHEFLGNTRVEFDLTQWRLRGDKYLDEYLLDSRVDYNDITSVRNSFLPRSDDPTGLFKTSRNAIGTWISVTVPSGYSATFQIKIRKTQDDVGLTVSFLKSSDPLSERMLTDVSTFISKNFGQSMMTISPTRAVPKKSPTSSGTGTDCHPPSCDVNSVYHREILMSGY